MSKEFAEREVSDWWEAAMRLGEQLGSDGPRGYYELTPTQWLKWAESELPLSALRSEPVGEVISSSYGGRIAMFYGIERPPIGTKLYAAPSRESRTDRQEPCSINPVWSGVCKRGTRSCTVDHAESGLSAEQIEQIGYGPWTFIDNCDESVLTFTSAEWEPIKQQLLRSLTARDEGIEAAAKVAEHGPRHVGGPTIIAKRIRALAKGQRKPEQDADELLREVLDWGLPDDLKQRIDAHLSRKEQK